MASPFHSGENAPAPKGRLRVLQTTDLHMHLLDYDYFSNRIDPGIGLLRLSHPIAALRSEAGVTTLLCDNGDTLQGNPLADHLAMAQNRPHPMILALNALEYDAMTLGNHDFDYGVGFLRRALQDADFPVVSANVTVTPDPQFARDFVLLDRQILCDDGAARPIRIGITGFAPPRTIGGDDTDSGTKIAVTDIVEAAQRVIPAIKAAGADLVIALCHAGIGGADHRPNMQNAAVPLAAVAGLDVILTGHTHGIFPDQGKPPSTHVDPERGLLHGKPAVMAGFHGRALGVVDLTLTWADGGWQITDHNVRLDTGPDEKLPTGPLQNKLEKLVATAHKATLAVTQAPIARTAIPIHSYFATVQPDLSQQLLGRAARQAVQTALSGTSCAGLPVLAADAPYRFGGQGGLSHYIDIPPGVVTQGDAAAIFPFADPLCAVRRTGAQIADWLERSASHYSRIDIGTQNQPLIDPQSAGYNCDALLGLSYEIDLTQPARFHPLGDRIRPDAQRIRHLCYNGRPVGPDDIFIVAVNSFRVTGSGGFAVIGPQDIVYVSPEKTRDILVRYLQEITEITQPAEQTWAFTSWPDTGAVFQSAPQAQAHLTDAITYIGAGQGGFARYLITF